MKILALALPLAFVMPTAAQAKETYLECVMEDKPDLSISIQLDDVRGTAYVKYEGANRGGRLRMSPDEAGINIGNDFVWRINRADLSVEMTIIRTFRKMRGQCKLAVAPPQVF